MGKKRKSRKWIKEEMKINEENSESNFFPNNMPFKRVAYIFHKSGLHKNWCEY